MRREGFDHLFCFLYIAPVAHHIATTLERSVSNVHLLKEGSRLIHCLYLAQIKDGHQTNTRETFRLGGAKWRKNRDNSFQTNNTHLKD
jgi:hypothetical protein